MALLRPQLKNIWRAVDLPKARHGERIRIAGNVIYGGTVVEQPEEKEQILHVTTAYAYAPEKVEQGRLPSPPL